MSADDPVKPAADAAPADAVPAVAPRGGQQQPATGPEVIYVTLAGDVNQVMVQRLFAAGAAAVNGRVKTIHLLLHSVGGSVMDGIAIYNYLRGLPIEITTYNAGGVMSAAVIIYLAGRTRRVSAGATFIIHKTTSQLPIPAGAAEMGRRVESLLVDDGRAEEILRQHITLPDAQWTTHAGGDLLLTAQ